MPTHSLPINRRILPWVLGTILIVLALIAGTRIVSLQEELRAQVSTRIEEQLEDIVAAWEDKYISLLDEWIEQFGSGRHNLLRRQTQLRNRTRWFDSVYIWELPSGTVPKKQNLMFPTESPSQDSLWVHAHPCIRRSKLIGIASGLQLEAVAEEILRNCSREGPNIRAVAALEAASIYDRNGKLSLSLEVLNKSGFSRISPIQVLIEKGVSPFRVVSIREFQSRILLKMGQTDASLDLLVATGHQISELNAPDAYTTVDFLGQIIARLKKYNRTKDVEALHRAFDQTNRRIRGWEEVSSRMIPESASLKGKSPRFVFDQYRDTPYLIYYGAHSSESKGVAIQMDQASILSSFMNTSRRYGKGIVVLDPANRWVAGAEVGESTVDIKVPFSKTLTHLTVGITSEFTESRMTGLNDQWIVPLIITTFCVILGFFALFAQHKANRRLHDLMNRQREFTTRVTHELKTPIAGIRIMAENLESGVYSADWQQKNTARQIITEADRLTQRVEEVLTLSKVPSLTQKEPFNLEEVCYELIELWGPRFEQHDVAFSADIDVTPDIVGDSREVRDAIGCLLDNALKYRDVASKPSTVHLRLTHESGIPQIEVLDNGLGVPKEMQRRVFERFQRVEGPNRGKAGGHGLGLAQVMDVAKLHQGTATCSTNSEKGARFVLRLKGR